jgi:hypothetical protein
MFDAAPDALPEWIGKPPRAMFAAGSDGVRNHDVANLLQRVFRDLQTGSTHRHVDGNVLIEATQWDLGVGPRRPLTSTPC